MHRDREKSVALQGPRGRGGSGEVQMWGRSLFGGCRVLEVGDGDGCATVWVSSVPQKCTLQNGSDGKLCVR